MSLSGEPKEPVVIDGVRYVPDLTCSFVPESTRSYFDDEDNEIETEEPSEDCGYFMCSNCGFPMMHGDEGGWFDLEPPYKPSFKFCPNCRARVVEVAGYAVADA